MPKAPPWLLKIIADNDQDRSECDAWMKAQSQDALLAVWMRIQRTHTDPIDEVISRLAQLAFAEAAARVNAPLPK